MTRYSVQPRDWKFVKGSGFFLFAKNTGKSIGKNVCKNLSVKFSEKFFDHAKQYVTDAFKITSKREIQKKLEATGHLICNKIGNKVTGVSKNPQQNNFETVTNEHDKEIHKELYISPEERQEIINGLTLK